jgi:hypothetical protein
MRRSIIASILLVTITGFAFAYVKSNSFHTQKAFQLAVTADDVINDYIKVMGGKDKLNSIKTLYMEGEINANGRKIPIKRWIVNNKGSRNERTINGMTSFSIIRPDSGWNFNAGRGQKTPEPMTASAIASAKPGLDLPGTLVDYATKGYSVVYEGTEDIEGTDAYKIEEIINDKLIYTFFFDPDSHYLMRLKTKSSIGGRVITSSTDFSFYQTTSDGYVFPLETGSIRYTTIKVNIDIDPKLFTLNR